MTSRSSSREPFPARLPALLALVAAVGAIVLSGCTADQPVRLATQDLGAGIDASGGDASASDASSSDEAGSDTSASEGGVSGNGGSASDSSAGASSSSEDSGNPADSDDSTGSTQKLVGTVDVQDTCIYVTSNNGDEVLPVFPADAAAEVSRGFSWNGTTYRDGDAIALPGAASWNINGYDIPSGCDTGFVWTVAE